MPGDWHLLKLAGETIRDMLWDGGLKDLAKLCGHHKEINQWRDVHNMLLSLHQILAEELTKLWQHENVDALEEKSFEKFLDALQNEKNSDEVSRFWASTFSYLCAYLGYFMAIRSGNWQLRNSCLPKLSELFFAYSHNKYEELVCKSMKDCMKLPTEVLGAFLRGEWTVSAKGIPFHSQAMDEAHESLVNKSTKDLTTKPTLYRIVELSNFMAVVNKVISGLTSVMDKFGVEKQSTSKQTTNFYSDAIRSVVCGCDLFSSKERKLCNVFAPKADVLNAENREDLLSVSKVGKARMQTYIRQFILEPPTEIRQKRRRNKLKTFSKPKSSIQTHKSQVSRLSKMAKS